MRRGNHRLSERHLRRLSMLPLQQQRDARHIARLSAIASIRRSNRVTAFAIATEPAAQILTTAQDLSGAFFRKRAFSLLDRAHDRYGHRVSPCTAMTVSNTVRSYSSTASAIWGSLLTKMVFTMRRRAKESPTHHSKATGETVSSVLESSFLRALCPT